jgi:hypothetical protein
MVRDVTMVLSLKRDVLVTRARKAEHLMPQAI